MKRLKIIILSIGIAFIIATLPVFFIIIPADKKHASLNKEERWLRAVEKKSDSIREANVENSKNMRFLQKALQEKPILSFLEDALNASQLSIESIKPNQGSGRDEIHLALKGKYRAFMHFVALLSRQPNSIVLINVWIEKNRIEIILKDGDTKPAFIKAKQPSSLLKRLDFALAAVEVPVFSLGSISVLKEVQSPFLPRVLLKKKSGSLQALAETDWYLSGEVRKNSVLLGVFLEAQHYSQSHYFGVGLPWENSDWRVIKITPSAVVFEKSKNHARWSLSYQSSL